MKKLLCISLLLCLCLSTVACNNKTDDNKNTSSKEHSVISTEHIKIVNDAFSKTADNIIGNSMEYGICATYSVSEDNKTEYSKVSSNVDFNYGSDKTVVSAYGTVKNSTVSSSNSVYFDGTNYYGYNTKLNKTHLIKQTETSEEYLKQLTESVKVVSVDKLTPTSTSLVTTSEDGYGFVFEYSVDNLDATFKETINAFVDESLATALPNKIKVSGIIGKEGYVQSQTITVSYSVTYDFEDNSKVDPNNPEAKPEIVTKTRDSQLVLEFDYDFDAARSITAAPDITVIPENNEQLDKPVSLTQISIEEFME